MTGTGTLVFRRRTSADMGQLFRPCDNGCMARVGSNVTGTGGLARASSTVEVLLMGRPAGFLCDKCKRDACRVWVENGGTVPAAAREQHCLRRAA